MKKDDLEKVEKLKSRLNVLYPDLSYKYVTKSFELTSVYNRINIYYNTSTAFNWCTMEKRVKKMRSLFGKHSTCYYIVGVRGEFLVGYYSHLHEGCIMRKFKDVFGIQPSI